MSLLRSVPCSAGDRQPKARRDRDKGIVENVSDQKFALHIARHVGQSLTVERKL